MSRNTTFVFRYILDNILPTFIRDSKWFMWPLFKLLFKGKTHYFFDFKDNLVNYSKNDIANIYKETAEVHIQRQTDLNKECISKILSSISGENVLDAGCGNGYLTRLLEKNFIVNSCDINNGRKCTNNKFIP